MEDQLLSRSDVERLLGVSRTTFFELRRSGSFPDGILIAKRCTRWRLGDVQAWIASQPQAAA